MLKKIQIALYDREGYMSCLVDYLCRKSHSVMETRLFTSLEMLKKAAEGGGIDVLLAGEEVAGEIRGLREKIPQIMLLSEGSQVSEKSDYYLLFKYQSAQNIVKEVLGQIAEDDRICYTQHSIVGRTADFIGVYAPFGGSGVTKYALSMAQGLAKQYKTLYVNMELFQGLNLLAEGKKGQAQTLSRGMSEVIFYLKQRKDKLALKLETLIISASELDYIMAVEDYRDLYAMDCENIAITGKGTLAPIMDTWKIWFKRPKPHMDALKELYTMASTDVPVEQRQMAKGENHLRPHLIHFNRCKNVLLDEFKIRQSPFWTIHLYMCDGGIVRNLDVKAHGHNNDGIDLEMSRNFLIENCVFDQGDDAVVIKAGRNQDAWRLNTPCENIVIRHCDILKGHTLLGIGSEMSGGVRNVYMHNCTAPDSVFRLFFAKTNHRRGGFIENIWMKNVKAGKMQRVLEVDTDVLYQWRDLVPTYQDSITFINGLYMDSVTCDRTEAVYDLKGDARLPIKNVEIRNVTVGEVTKFVKNVVNAENVVEENIIYKEKQDKQ